MKRILIKTLTCTIALALTVFVTVGYAEWGSNSKPCNEGEEGQRKGKGRHEEIAKMLNLTPEQEELTSQHRKQHRKKMKEISQALKEKRKALYQELEKYDGDQAKIASLAAEVKALLAKKVDSRVESILAMKQILTPEQFEKLQTDVKKKAGQRHGKRHGKGRGR